MPLGEIADVNWGDTNVTKKSYVENGFTAFSASGPDGFLPYFDFDKTGVVLSAIGAKCGLTWLARGKWSCIKNTIRFWSKLDHIPTEYLFLATKGQDFWPRRGSAQPFISQGDSRAIRILIPSPPICKIFADTVVPFFERIEKNDLESRTLAQTRDLLLPRLMSGEIRVREAEAIVEGV
jgi:type I restriction enzyme S subunit